MGSFVENSRGSAIISLENDGAEPPSICPSYPFSGDSCTKVVLSHILLVEIPETGHARIRNCKAW